MGLRAGRLAETAEAWGVSSGTIGCLKRPSVKAGPNRARNVDQPSDRQGGGPPSGLLRKLA